MLPFQKTALFFKTLLKKFNGAFARDQIWHFDQRGEDWDEAFAITKVGFWKWDLKTDLETRNATFNYILGFKPKETILPKKDFIECVHTDDRAALQEMFQKVVLEQKEYEIEFRIYCQNGETRWIRKHGKIQYNKHHQPIYVIGTAIDVTPYKQKEEELRKKEQQLRLIVEACPAFITYIDQERRYRFVNKAYAERHGFTPETILGKHLKEIVGDAVYEKICPYLDQGFAGQAMDYEVTIPYEDIGTRDFLVDFAPDFGSDGKVNGLIAIINDITGRKQAEEALKQSEERLRLAQKCANAGTWEWDITTGHEVWSEEFYKLYGLDPVIYQASYETWLALVHPEDRSFAIQATWKAIEDHVELNLEHRILHPQKGIRWLASLGKTLYNSNGCAIRMAGITIDVTARKQAELALKESESRFRTMADNAPVLIWVSDTQKKGVYFNKMWLNFTGRKLEEELGDGWVMALHPEDSKTFLQVCYNAFRRLEPFQTQVRLRRFDGEYRWVLDTGVPRFDAAGVFVGYIGSCIDVTDQKQAQEVMRDLNKTLELRVEERTSALREANAQMESFTYSVSHDLRSPLRSIMSFSEILKDSCFDHLDDQAKDFLQRICTAAQKMDNLIIGLLMYSRASRQELHLEEVKLKEVIFELLNKHQAVVQERQAKIEVSKNLHNVIAHPIFLFQAMENIFLNAIKFVAPNTTPFIRIWSEEIRDKIRICIEDNGIGIASQYHERIFDIFERLHGESVYEGTGIGLAIVRKSIERIGGDVGLESTLGQGSKFWIELPAAE